MKLPSQKITDIGEFGLIERITRLVTKTHRLYKTHLHHDIALGIGDDAALLIPPQGNKQTLLAISKDMLVEGVHFRRGWLSFYEIGRKAIVANISDMAAMGGAAPGYIVVGLALPVDISVDNVDKLFRGMDTTARSVGAEFIGGDTVRSDKKIVISITIIGDIKKEKVTLRSGARPQDYLCVTGTFGDSGAGLEILMGSKNFNFSGWRGQLVNKYRRPSHRLELSRALLKLSASGIKPTAMIDSSDGLAASLRMIISESSKKSKTPLGAVIRLEDIPLSHAFIKWSETKIQSSGRVSLMDLSGGSKNFLLSHPRFPWKTALEGGEEYELVFTVSPENLEKLKKLARFKVIGRVISSKDSSVIYTLNDKPVIPLMKTALKGYENF